MTFAQHICNLEASDRKPTYAPPSDHTLTSLSPTLTEMRTLSQGAGGRGSLPDVHLVGDPLEELRERLLQEYERTGHPGDYARWQHSTLNRFNYHGGHLELHDELQKM